jgi:hypothetical protein
MKTPQVAAMPGMAPLGFYPIEQAVKRTLRETCNFGHAFDGVNSRGHRTCSICAQASWKRAKDKAKKARRALTLG